MTNNKIFNHDPKDKDSKIDPIQDIRDIDKQSDNPILK